VRLVAGLKLPRSTRMGRLYSTSDGCTTSPLAVNIAASVSPRSTSCKLRSRLSRPANAGPASFIMSTSIRSRERSSIRESIRALRNADSKGRREH
jgi:hypothetical protein